ncbi:MAG TPA: hypothetical protein PKL75_02595 [Treponemataceae bacterium]|nr:hypothetical protein [Treponemataceae bacterium]
MKRFQQYYLHSTVRPRGALRLYVALCVALCAALSLASCGLPRSAVSMTALDGRALALRALSPEAQTGVVSGANRTAWFAFNPAHSGLVSREKKGGAAGKGPTECTIEVTLASESSDPVTVSFGAVTGADLGPDGKLVASPGKRPLAVAEAVTGEMTLGICVPVADAAKKDTAVRGFAVSVSGGSGSRVKIISARVTRAQSLWSRRSGSIAFVPSAAGGKINLGELRSGALPRILVPEGSFVTLDFAPSADGAGSIEKQSRAEFRSGRSSFSVRASPSPHRASIPSFVLTGTGPEAGNVFLTPETGAEGLVGVEVTHGAPLPVVDSSSSVSPISADPSLIVEWPQDRWRNREYEVFSWDSFPTVLIFDTADYAVQDRLFKRLAFFVEKQGYRGKILSDAELAGLHAYNAHDYRAESLAAFFDAASRAGFALGKEEIELRRILVAEGIIVAKGKGLSAGFAPGAGAVISISRESASYLRYMFIAHESYHGIYFVDPDFRAEVSRVYRSMDPRAIEFLHSYFTVFASLGYDTSDPYLMENEFMAYMLQQPLDRVGPYFTGVISDRYRKRGGDPKLLDYIATTNATDFVRAADELNDYVFTRWGIAGGRVGLYLGE